MEPAARREQILGHAADLFGSKGYHATSVNDIIQAAGIARGTFYLYFESKRAIFAELVDALLDRLTGRIQIVDTAPEAPSAREQLLDNMTRVIELFIEERPLLSILLEGVVGLDHEFDERLADFYGRVAGTIESSLKLGQELGLVRDCDTRIASLAVLGALKEVLQDLLRNGGSAVDLGELTAQILDVFSVGVLVEGMSIP